MRTSDAPSVSGGGLRNAIFTVARRGTSSPPGETATRGRSSGVAVAGAVAVGEGEAAVVGEAGATTVGVAVLVGEGELTAGGARRGRNRR